MTIHSNRAKENKKTKKATLGTTIKRGSAISMLFLLEIMGRSSRT
jgi:hypothetical protein